MDYKVEECFLEIRNGASIKQGVVGGGFPITRIETLADGKFNRDRMGYAGITEIEEYSGYVLEDGDLLMSHINSPKYLGRTVVYHKQEGEVFIHGMNLLKLKTKRDILVPDFAEYLFTSYGFKSQIAKIMKKSVNQASFSVSDLRKLTAKVPSLIEQSEMVNKLHKVKQIVNDRNIQLEMLKELIKSRFVEMFGAVVDKIMVKELCDVSGGYSFKSTDIIDEGIKLLQISNVALNQVDWDVKNYLPIEFERKYSNFLMERDDIVMALTRPIIQSLGNVKTCIVNDSDLPCLLNQRVGKIKVKDTNKTKVQFIYHCFMTEGFTRYVESCCTGCSQPNISTKNIESYEIPNVSIDLQNEFATFVQQVDKLKVEVQKSLEETQTLFDGLMQKYFE